MRWFIDPTYYFDDAAEWDEVLNSYFAHIRQIEPRLPPALAALAIEPRFNLHDAAIRSVEVDDDAQLVTMRVVAGDLQVGYWELALTFRGAALVPDNLQLLAYALGARYQTDHWGVTTTVIRAQEIDVSGDDRFVLRLRLWPFYEFAIEFADMELSEIPSEPPGRLTGVLIHR